VVHFASVSILKILAYLKVESKIRVEGRGVWVEADCIFMDYYSTLAPQPSTHPQKTLAKSLFYI
jgi:hypothetical protein